MATHYIPFRGQAITGPTASIAVAGITLSAAACFGLSLSAILHIFGSLAAAPILGEAFVTNRFWLAFWNIVMPGSMLGITLCTYRSWRKRESANL